MKRGSLKKENSNLNLDYNPISESLRKDSRDRTCFSSNLEENNITTTSNDNNNMFL